MKKLFLTIFLLTFLMAGCSENEEIETDNTQQVVAILLGQGESVFSFKMTDREGELFLWEISTNEKTVGAALLEVGLISGEVGMYGLQVMTVNGITADYAVDESWWKFLIDGEMAVKGVDSTEIEQGKTYAFEYTIG